MAENVPDRNFLLTGQSIKKMTSGRVKRFKEKYVWLGSNLDILYWTKKKTIDVDDAELNSTLIAVADIKNVAMFLNKGRFHIAMKNGDDHQFEVGKKSLKNFNRKRGTIKAQPCRCTVRRG